MALKKYQQLIIRMLSTHNLYIPELSDKENEILQKGLSWYGHFLANIKIMSKKMPAPAASTLDRKRLQPIIFINDELFDKYPDHEKIAILKHETLHILNQHFSRKTEYENNNLWNIATDLAINQLIPFIPEEGLHLDKFNEMFNLSLKAEMPAEYYYKEIEKNLEECEQQSEQDNNTNKEDNKENENNRNNQQDSSGNKECETCKKLKQFVESCNGVIDSHELWEEISEAEKKLISENIENLIKETNNKNRGNIPAEIEAILELMLQKHKINWKKYIKKLLSNKKIGHTKTIKRRDKRFPKRLDLKGNKKDITGDILVVLDVSGSMSNEEIMKGLSELFYIIKIMKYKIHLVEVDTEPKIYPDFDKDIKKLKFKRLGCGGTYLFPGIKKADEMKIPYGYIIIVTDGYIENLEEWEYIPKKPITFLLTDENENFIKNEFGSIPNVKIFNLK